MRAFRSPRDAAWSPASHARCALEARRRVEFVRFEVSPSRFSESFLVNDCVCLKFLSRDRWEVVGHARWMFGHLVNLHSCYICLIVSIVLVCFGNKLCGGGGVVYCLCIDTDVRLAFQKMFGDLFFRDDDGFASAFTSRAFTSEITMA